MASVVQYGRRKGSSKRVSSAEDATGVIQPVDLRQVTVLTEAEWQRIQDELHQVNREQESLTEEATQRENLHLQAKEMVKLWSNTIAGQRQKKLEAKKIREQNEEEKRKLIDKEEAEYQKQLRRETIEKTNTQLFHQTDRVKGLYGALLLTEVLKEREGQVELKQRLKSASKDKDKNFLEAAKKKSEEHLRQEQQKALEKKHERQAVVQELKKQIEEKKLVKEQEKIEKKKEREENEQLLECYQLEQRKKEEREAKKRKNLMQTHLEHVTKGELIRATDAKTQEGEEKQRNLFLQMVKMRKDKEKELLREAQTRREKMMNRVMVKESERERDVREEQRFAKAVAERDAKQALQQYEEQERRAAMLESIAAHREFMEQEKKQRDQKAKQICLDSLEAKKEADRIFSEKQQLKAQRTKEDRRKQQDFHAKQMAEKQAKQQQQITQELEFEMKTMELIAEEENQFQQYAQQLITAAAEAQRNVFPLCKAAREGTGGGFGPVCSGVRPRYLVQDSTGTQMPKYVTDATQNMKKRNETVDIEEAKKRLGFTW